MNISITTRYWFFTFFALTLSNQALSKLPETEFLLAMSHSVAKVHVEDQHGELGVGSGVVVAKNHIATNCHVVAHAHGIAVNKFGNSYAPIAMKADWQHDLCILIFTDLPLKPFPLGDIENIQYEQAIIALGFSGNAPRPIESFGSVKALIPFDGSVLIRTSSGFRMGASGGALIDYEGNLLGITTFKSPGRKGFFYSLPIKWVKNLLNSDQLSETKDAQPPFWDVPETERPFFMQAVILLHSNQWEGLAKISQQWIEAEQNNPEAWLYLGTAQKEMQQLILAKQSLQKVLEIAPKHSSALFLLGKIAILENDQAEAIRIGMNLKNIDVDFAEYYHEDTGLTPSRPNN